MYFFRRREGKPEKVRTTPCLVAPLWPAQQADKQGVVVFSGLLLSRRQSGSLLNSLQGYFLTPGPFG